MDILPAGFFEWQQLLSRWSDTETQMHKRVGEPFLIEAILTVRVRFGSGIAGHSSEGNFAMTRRNQYFAGIIGEPTPAASSDDACLMIVPCEKHVTWFLSDESGRLIHVFDKRLSLATFLTSGDKKLCRISIGTEEVQRRIEEFFVQKPDGLQAISALVFSSALKKVGVQMFGPNFSSQFAREAEQSLNGIVKRLLETDGKGNTIASSGELEKINRQYALLVDAGMREDDLCDTIASGVVERTCGRFFRERNIHCVAVALGEEGG